MRPDADSPSNLHGECDCSGFVCWAFGVSRFTNHPLYRRLNGGWINTDAMVADACDDTGFFKQLGEAEVGCVIVFPASRPQRKYGHVGIVTEVSLVAGTAKITRVLHCSRGNYRAYGDAIVETSPGSFGKPDAICAWYEGVERVTSRQPLRSAENDKRQAFELQATQAYRPNH